MTWFADAIDHEADAERLRQCLASGQSRILGEGDALVPLGEGDFCVAFRSSARVIRVAKHAEAASALRLEACVLGSIAERLPLPVPRPTFHEPACCPPLSVHDMIHGEVLTRRAWLGMPARKRDRVAAELGRFLSALHGTPRPEGLHCGLSEIRLDEIAGKLAAGALRLRTLLGEERQRRLMSVLQHCVADPGDGEATAAVLVHRDIAPGHLLYDPPTGGLTGIIDFGDLALADPARDFIYIFEDFGTELLDAVLAHYDREPAQSLAPRVRLWYLLEAVAWTIQMGGEGRKAEETEGVSEIIRILETGAPLWQHC